MISHYQLADHDDQSISISMISHYQIIHFKVKSIIRPKMIDKSFLIFNVPDKFHHQFIVGSSLFEGIITAYIVASNQWT
jgi:hypothetical protein